MSPFEKTLALDEVDEHQPVEHERGVPLSVALVGDALDERQEGRVLSLEVVVEASGDPVAVEGIAQAEDHAGQGEALFFIQWEGDGFQLLDERIARLMLSVIVVLAIGGGLARLTRYPLPDLHGPGGIDKNDEMLVR